MWSCGHQLSLPGGSFELCQLSQLYTYTHQLPAYQLQTVPAVWSSAIIYQAATHELHLLSAKSAMCNQQLPAVTMSAMWSSVTT